MKTTRNVPSTTEISTGVRPDVSSCDTARRGSGLKGAARREHGSEGARPHICYTTHWSMVVSTMARGSAAGSATSGVRTIRWRGRTGVLVSVHVRGEASFLCTRWAYTPHVTPQAVHHPPAMHTHKAQTARREAVPRAQELAVCCSALDDAPCLPTPSNTSPLQKHTLTLTKDFMLMTVELRPALRRQESSQPLSCLPASLVFARQMRSRGVAWSVPVKGES